MNRDLRAVRERREGDRINEERREERREALRQRRARRRAFWTDVSDIVLSMPAAIGLRLGG